MFQKLALSKTSITTIGAAMLYAATTLTSATPAQADIFGDKFWRGVARDVERSVRRGIRRGVDRAVDGVLNPNRGGYHDDHYRDGLRNCFTVVQRRRDLIRCDTHEGQARTVEIIPRPRRTLREYQILRRGY